MFIGGTTDASAVHPDAEKLLIGTMNDDIEARGRAAFTAAIASRKSLAEAQEAAEDAMLALGASKGQAKKKATSFSPVVPGATSGSAPSADAKDLKMYTEDLSLAAEKGLPVPVNIIGFTPFQEYQTASASSSSPVSVRVVSWSPMRTS